MKKNLIQLSMFETWENIIRLLETYTCQKYLILDGIGDQLCGRVLSVLFWDVVARLYKIISCSAIVENIPWHVFQLETSRGLGYTVVQSERGSVC